MAGRIFPAEFRSRNSNAGTYVIVGLLEVLKTSDSVERNIAVLIAQLRVSGEDGRLRSVCNVWMSYPVDLNANKHAGDVSTRYL